MLSAAICHGARTFLPVLRKEKGDHSKLSKSKSYFNRFSGFMQQEANSTDCCELFFSFLKHRYLVFVFFDVHSYVLRYVY